MVSPIPAASQERPIHAFGGFPMLVINLLLVSAAPLALAATTQPRPAGVIFVALLVSALGVLSLKGHFSLQPNEARVLILFGHYRGTVRDSGFHWANPFYARYRGRVPSKGQWRPDSLGQTRIGGQATTGIGGQQWWSSKLSLRANNFNSPTLKVNDKRGNPVEIAAVVVWRVQDTAMAVFDVADFASYVEVQSESALRSIASRFAYDHGHESEPTLRGSADEVAHELAQELQQRLAKAGVLVEEARLTHLAYAAEIAPIMLRRQQAEAIISARQIIVQNAVGMVHMALAELERQNTVTLDDERKAAMVSNLLVVLCGNSDASPVINTGTLYS
ncbi:MAG TPA: SPFH domain-containing protein [Steroidobacteraceae bacterium]|nr:SPFH domain-containing protein [Steroidobacteraceae bacterium]